jgi:hypothetical protein
MLPCDDVQEFCGSWTFSLRRGSCQRTQSKRRAPTLLLRGEGLYTSNPMMDCFDCRGRSGSMQMSDSAKGEGWGRNVEFPSLASSLNLVWYQVAPAPALRRMYHSTGAWL